MTVKNGTFSTINISKTIAGATVPIESLINKLQGNAKIGRKNLGKKKQNTYLKTSHLTRGKQTLFDSVSNTHKNSDL